MRTVRDARGVTWICLELPEVPTDQLPNATARGGNTVAIECNSGAARVIALVDPGWDDDMDDARLTETITAFAR
ncbi:MAG TPA: hypothetical protein VE869_09870 [Gemmatimonas sp.]|nr:hypothetical protein [Gemmatimonas sp.]